LVSTNGGSEIELRGLLRIHGAEHQMTIPKMNFHHRKIDSRRPPEKLPQNFASECSLNVMFKHLILLLFFFAPVPGLFASITVGRCLL
jgi:hypothetical protein